MLYKISGTNLCDSPVYLSLVSSDKTLKESVIATIPKEEIGADGSFTFSEIFTYSKTTTLAVWVKIKIDPDELGKFYATATLLSAPQKFLFKYKKLQMPAQIEEGTVSNSSLYKVQVRGSVTIKTDTSPAINLATLYTDGQIPNNYYRPPSDQYYADDENLKGNVIKGIYEIENGILIPSDDNENFQIFMSSISTISGGTAALLKTDKKYELECEWGHPGDSNMVLVWMILTDKDEIEFTIEDIDDSDTEGEKDGITWNPVCLAGDTMISMADGTSKRLDSIKAGDKVLAKDNKVDIVAFVKRNFFSDYHTLYYFDDGTIIDETHDHRFYNKTQGFWQRLKLWNVGDVAIDLNGREVHFIKKEVINERIENFGIFTYSGTYYANGLLSGAASCNRELLPNATTEQAIDMMLSIDEADLLKLFGVEKDLL